MAPSCPEACALFERDRQVSERVAVALRRDAKLLLPHVARVGAAAGEQNRDLAVPRFEFKLGENRRNYRDQREESPFAVCQHSEQVELGRQLAKSGANFGRLPLRDRFMGPRVGLPTLYP